MSKPTIEYDRVRRRHTITLTLDPDEAENIAASLGPGDKASQELFDAADHARAADVERIAERANDPRLVVRMERA